MPALLHKLQKHPTNQLRRQGKQKRRQLRQQQQQQQQQQQHQQQQQQRIQYKQRQQHYLYQLYRNQRKYLYQHYYQHGFLRHKAKEKEKTPGSNFYNLNTNICINSNISRSSSTSTSSSSNSNIIIIATRTTVKALTSTPSTLPITITKIPPLSISSSQKSLPISTSGLTRQRQRRRRTATTFNITTGRLYVAILALMLSIICHYSNAEEISVASAENAGQQLPENFHQNQPKLLSNNNVDSKHSTHNSKYNNSDYNNNASNLTSHINTESNSLNNFSVTLENQLSESIVENYTTIRKPLKSLSIIDLERIHQEEVDIQSIDSQPIFDFGMPRNITGRTSQTEAIIKCRVDMLNDKSVSWIRKRDLHILTVGTTTYTTDKRFEVSTTKDEREWSLHIKNPQSRDSGIYECQVNTEPKISMGFQLNIIETPADAKAVITGPPDLHFKVGSVIVLQCLVAQPTVKDIGPIYWYRGEQMITPFQQDDNSEHDMNAAADNAFLSSASMGNVDGDAGANPSTLTTTEKAHTMNDLINDITLDFTARIAMESQLGDTLKSRLRISNAQTMDTGNYTCQPTTASSASVMVHVINDENPAAMQKSAASSLNPQTTIVSMKATTTTTTIIVTTATRIPLCSLTLPLLTMVSRRTNTLKIKKILLVHVLVSLFSHEFMAMTTMVMIIMMMTALMLV